MYKKSLRLILIISVLLLKNSIGIAQDKRTEFPGFLQKKYIGVSVGYINYTAPELKFEPGFSAQRIVVSHPGVRLVFGHRFNKNFAAQISYMRPVNWILYRNVNGDSTQHSVWTNVLGLSFIPRVYLLKNLSAYAETGLGFVTQDGFKVYGVTAVKDASYLTLVLGAGLQYELNHKWNFQASAFSTMRSKSRQAYKVFYSGGFICNIYPPKKKPMAKKGNSPFIFPKNIIQASFSTNNFGYKINDYAEGAYIFWGGDVEVRHAFSLYFQHNFFHTRRLFSFSWGGGISYLRSRRNNDDFLTISVFPLLRLTPIHTKPADFYLNYCLAGPTFISRVHIDGHDTGDHFTFLDYMGIGAFVGKERDINVEVRIAHYSNGDLVPQNGGIKVPLTFTAGYAF